MGLQHPAGGGQGGASGTSGLSQQNLNSIVSALVTSTCRMAQVHVQVALHIPWIVLAQMTGFVSSDTRGNSGLYNGA